jgi:hypothetical protein
VDERDLERLAVGMYGPSDDDAAEQRALIERMVAHAISVEELTAPSEKHGW